MTQPVRTKTQFDEALLGLALARAFRSRVAKRAHAQTEAEVDSADFISRYERLGRQMAAMVGPHGV